MKILIADDDTLSLLLLRQTVEDWGYQVTTATDGNQACAILEGADAPMLAIIDGMMPGMDGIDVCRRVRQYNHDRYTYLIMLTARNETAFMVEAMNAGADDFISKPFNYEELQVRLRAGQRIIELEQQLRVKATRDALTGIYNRGTIIDLLEREIARQKRDQQPFAMLFADLDHFKKTNDTYGHLAGDAVLCEIARRIASALRPYDSLGRYGGEELLLVLPVCDAVSAVEVANRIRNKIAFDPVVTEFGLIPTTLSIGVAVMSQTNSETLNDLIKRADDALYSAKKLGRNRVELAPEK